MRTLRYSIFILVMIVFATIAGCKGKNPGQHGHSADTIAEDHEDLGQAGEKGEAEGEHEELPDYIVEMDADQINFAGIELGNVEIRHVSGVIKANGIVSTSPQNKASVSVPMGGFIKSSSLLPGSFVSKGQTLAVIENIEFVELQEQYFEIKNRFEYAEAEYNRHNELYKDDVYSEKNVQQTASEYRSLKAKVKGVEEKLSVLGINPSRLTEDGISASISLSAPISGYIKSANISIGQYVSPTDVLFEIINPNNLLLELTLFEKDANSIVAGQVAHFSIDNEVHEHKATIYQVGKSINEDKTYKIFATVLQPCTNVLPGMYVVAHIEKSNKQVTSVPEVAVVSFDNKNYIFAFEREKEEAGKPFTEYRFIEVVRGATNDGYTEIQLPEGFNLTNTRIVTKGAYNLLSAKKNAGEMTCG